MRTVTLGTTGLTTSVLGYGCAGLLRPATGAERDEILRAAFDSGIRHFDTARYYGHGACEGALGKFLSDHRLRDQVTLTTKFGIQPTPLGKSSFGKSIMAVARRIATMHPSVRRAMAGYAGRSVRMNCFDPAVARTSLETSLRELRTDHIDLYLLHEADLGNALTPGLLEFLQEAQQSGKIRAFGCATGKPQTLDILDRAPAFTSVIQIANAVGQWNLEDLPGDSDRFFLTHGSLKPLADLETALAQTETGTFRSLRGSDLAAMLLGLSLHKNPRGITLFSSTQPRRIRENVRGALNCDSLTPEEWSEFQGDAEKLLPVPPSS